MENRVVPRFELLRQSEIFLQHRIVAITAHLGQAICMICSHFMI